MIRTKHLPTMTITTMNNEPPFWSDDFDMDLLKVIPNVREDLGEYADRTLWTVGHVDKRNGRLNHPVCWNTHGAFEAFAWLQKPNLVRDKYGWFNIGGCVGDEPEVECTWLELLRDQWAHSYAFILLPSRSYFYPARRRHFDRLMYRIRGWEPDSEAAAVAEMKGRLWVVESTRRLKRAITEELR